MNIHGIGATALVCQRNTSKDSDNPPIRENIKTNSHRQESSGTQGTSEKAAKALLVHFLFKYPERKDFIVAWVNNLLDDGLDAVAINGIVTSKMKEMEPEILAEREERMERIRNPQTRPFVEPLTEFERSRIAKLNEMDAMEEQVAKKNAEELAKHEARMRELDDEINALAAHSADKNAETCEKANKTQSPEVEAVKRQMDELGREAAALKAAVKKPLNMQPSSSTGDLPPSMSSPEKEKNLKETHEDEIENLKAQLKMEKNRTQMARNNAFPGGEMGPGAHWGQCAKEHGFLENVSQKETNTCATQ